MVLVAIFLVFLPIIREPMHSVVAFTIVLSGVPIYFIFVNDYKQRPKIFTTINGKYLNIITTTFKYYFYSALEYMTRYMCLLLNTSLAAQYQDEFVQ